VPRLSRSLLAVPVLALVLLAGSCGDDGTADDSSSGDPAFAAAAALEAAGRSTTTAPSDTDPADDEPEPLDPTTIPGEIIDKYALEVGECFDRLEDLRAGRPVIITTRLACDEPHHFQIFAELSYPAEHPSLYPGDDIMFDFALRSCYQRFPGWVGTTYELSELEIGVITPDRENFENNAARYRGIHCWVEHVAGEELTDTMRGSGR
jgi:hypothetical protein